MDFAPDRGPGGVTVATPGDDLKQFWWANHVEIPLEDGRNIYLHFGLLFLETSVGQVIFGDLHML